MILVSAFYVISWSPNYIIYIAISINADLVIDDIAYYVGMFLTFFYIGANPFIYAFNFSPVRRVLVGLVCWNKSVQAGNSVDTPVAPAGTAASHTTNQHK